PSSSKKGREKWIRLKRTISGADDSQSQERSRARSEQPAFIFSSGRRKCKQISTPLHILMKPASQRKTHPPGNHQVCRATADLSKAWRSGQPPVGLAPVGRQYRPGGFPEALFPIRKLCAGG